MTRTIDLLVLNQGHGEIGRFEDWTASDLSTYLVQPMVKAQIRVGILVLDFCESASLIGTFAPLLAPDGILIATLYSTGALVSTEAWSQIDAPLQRRDVYTVRAMLEARIQDLTRRITGLSHQRQLLAATEAQIGQHLRAAPQDADALSILRNLSRIAGAVNNATLAQAHAELLQVATSPNLGGNEAALFAFLPRNPAQYDAAAAATFRARFADRVLSILTLPQYGLQVDVANLPLLFGNPSRWQLVMENRDLLLSQATGLRRCPSPYALFSADGQTLDLDAEFLRAPLAAPVAERLMEVDGDAVQRVPIIVQQLATGGTVQTVPAKPNYMQ